MSADGLFDLAYAYFSVGQIDQAEITAQRAIKAGNNSAELKSLIAMAQLYKKPESRAGGESQVQSILKSNPDYLPALAIQGLLEQQKNRPKEARDIFEKILKSYPSFAPARKSLAALYTDSLNDQAKALDHATEARKALVDDPDLSRILGRISYRRNDHRNAVRYFQESTRQFSEDGESFYYLGFAHYQLNQKADGQKALEKALKLNPNASMANEARRVMAPTKK